MAPPTPLSPVASDSHVVGCKSPLQQMRRQFFTGEAAAATTPIPVVYATNMTPQQFHDEFVEPCRPAVLEGVMERCTMIRLLI